MSCFYEYFNCRLPGAHLWYFKHWQKIRHLIGKLTAWSLNRLELCCIKIWKNLRRDSRQGPFLNKLQSYKSHEVTTKLKPTPWMKMDLPNFQKKICFRKSSLRSSDTVSILSELNLPLLYWSCWEEILVRFSYYNVTVFGIETEKQKSAKKLFKNHFYALG